MTIEVVQYQPEWPDKFQEVAHHLRAALRSVDSAVVEHVGSTAVPGLAAKPVLDIDVIVDVDDRLPAVAALESIGYAHRGDQGLPHREAFLSPDEDPRRNVYVCTAGTIHVRNHLAVRDVLRAHSALRDEYAAIKVGLAAQPGMTVELYVAGKSQILQRVLRASNLISDTERAEILELNRGLDGKMFGQSDVAAVEEATDPDSPSSSDALPKEAARRRRPTGR